MSFSLRHKRILLIQPTEAIDFAKELVIELTRKGVIVYTWVWSIENTVTLLDEIPETCTPITLDVTTKTYKYARGFLSLLPPMDFIIKFSKTTKSLSPEFIISYGFLIGTQYYPIIIKEVTKNVNKIISKMQKSNGGVILNIGGASSKESTVSTILTQPLKNLMKFGSSKDDPTPCECDDEDSPLLPQQQESNTNIGATVNLERNGSSFGIIFRCFGCCDCCWGSTTGGGGNNQNIDEQIRLRLRDIHLKAMKEWDVHLQDSSNNEKQKYYNDLVEKQFDALIELTNRHL